MRKLFVRIGSLLGLLAVALGAMGSHALEDLLGAERIATFEIGVRYQFYHALAILAVGMFLHIRKTKFLITAGWFFVFGIILFSGSLYLLAFQDEMFEFPIRIVGPLTPIGGILFIIGWGFLFASTYQKVESRNA